MIIEDTDTESDDAADAIEPVKTEAAPPAAKSEPAADKGKAPVAKVEPPAKGRKASIVTGADADAEDAEKEAAAAKDAKPYWPGDWREKVAEHMSAGDKKLYEKELRRLQRVADPAGIYGNWRELEAKFTGGGLLKMPGKDAKPEEIAAFHKALGVPEKPEDYLTSLKLANGAVLGAADKPVVLSFAGELHKAGATPEILNAAVNWQFQQQELVAAAQDEADDTFRRESETKLKEEMGAAYKRQTNAIAALFATAPGGSDVKNEGGLFSRLMGGRMADGRVIGNDPDMVRFLVSLVSEVNPAATVVEDGPSTSRSIDEEIKGIEKRMREDRKAYFKDEGAQARYRELVSARDKIQSRSRG